MSDIPRQSTFKVEEVQNVIEQSELTLNKQQLGAGNQLDSAAFNNQSSGSRKITKYEYGEPTDKKKHQPKISMGNPRIYVAEGDSNRLAIGSFGNQVRM
jgi:hypothetical protein